MEFYYYSHGQRIGPIDTAKLKELAQQEVIVLDTPVENDGKIYPARKVKGLFPEETTLPPVHDDPPPIPQPEPEPQPSNSSGGERVVIIQQPAPQTSTEHGRAPSPYPVRVVREPRSYAQRQRAERLERTSHSLAAWGWLFLILGFLAEAIGVGFFIYEFITENAVSEETIGALSGGVLGLFFCAGGIHPFIFAEIMFFLSALGYKVAGDE